MKDEALRLALEALENPWKAGPNGVADAITAIKQALEQSEPVQQEKDWGAVAEKRYSAIRQATKATMEDAVVRAVHKTMQKEPVPVATIYEGAIAMWNLPEKFTGFLYTSQPKREPLTDEEILAVARDHYNPHQRPEISFARAIEAAHGIKGEA